MYSFDINWKIFFVNYNIHFKLVCIKPIDPKFGLCVPSPDEVRAMGCQDTILHELMTEGLTHYFNELIGISKNDVHHLQEKAQFIVKKMNGRNRKGRAPLLLAIQLERDEFIAILLNNRADIKGCSPLHYACRQVNPWILKK